VHYITIVYIHFIEFHNGFSSTFSCCKRGRGIPRT
jgi:hypothetical protein